MDFVIQWIDIVWLVLAPVLVRSGQRLYAALCVGSCMLMMRMQVEFLQSINHDHGIINLLNSHVFSRGLTVYSIFYIIYFLLALYSPHTKGVIFVAASISVFFAAFFVSSIVMVL